MVFLALIIAYFAYRVNEKALIKNRKGRLKPSFLSIQLIFQSQIVGNHGDELRVGGLTAIVLNGIAEIGVERIYVASIPSDFYSVADGAFNAAGCGGVLFGNAGVEHFCY